MNVCVFIDNIKDVLMNKARYARLNCVGKMYNYLM